MKERSVSTFILLCVTLSWLIEVLLQVDIYSLVDWEILLPVILYYICTRRAIEAYESRDDVTHAVFAKLASSLCIVVFVSTNLSLLSNITKHLTLCHMYCGDDCSVDINKCPVNRLGETVSVFYYLTMCITRYIPGGVLPMLLHAKSDNRCRFTSDTRYHIYDENDHKFMQRFIPAKRYLPALLILCACMFVELLPFRSTYVLISWWPTMTFFFSFLLNYNGNAQRHDPPVARALAAVASTLSAVSILYATLDVTKNGLFLMSGPCVLDGQLPFEVECLEKAEDHCLQTIMSSGSSRSDVQHCPINKLGSEWASVLYVCWALRALVLIFYQGFIHSVWTTKLHPMSSDIAQQMAVYDGELPPNHIMEEEVETTTKRK